MWNRAYQIGDVTRGVAVRRANDDPNGYVMVGHSQTLTGDNKQIFVMRVDPLGTPIWTKIFGGTPSRSYAVEAEIRSCTTGYIVCGTVFSSAEGGEVGYLIRITDAGSLTWMRLYQQVATPSDFTRFNDVQQIGSGGFVVTGTSFSLVPSGMFQNLTETLVMEMDSTGNVVWAKQYPFTEGADFGESIIATPTGYAVTGTLESFGFPASQLFTTDPAGNLVWYRRLDNFIQGGYSIEDSPANGTLHIVGNGDLAFEGGSFGNEAAIVRFDALGNFVAGQSYGFNTFHYGSSSVVEPGGGFTFTGIASDGVNRDYYLVRTNPILESGCNDMPFSPLVSAPPVMPIALTYTTHAPVEEVQVSPSVAPRVWDEYIQCQSSNCLDAVPIICTVIGGLDVNVSWPPFPATLDTAELWRNGTLLVTVTGTDYTDTSPPFGTNTYELILYDVDPLCDPVSSTCTATVGISIPVIDVTDVLISVWDPITDDDPIICWNDALISAGRNPRIFNSIDDITPDIGSNTGVTPIVWLSLGQAPFSHRLTPSEGQAIAAYLAAGGSLYIEGGDVASANVQSAFSQMDGVVAIAGGTLDGSIPELVGLDTGIGPDASSLSVLYRGPGRFVDSLAPDGNGAAALFESTGLIGETTAIYYDASISGNGTHKVITSSTLMSGWGSDVEILVSFVTHILSPPHNDGFIRGDSNVDGSVDIGDPIHSLAYLFASGPADCLRAQDVNDDGSVDIGDPVYSLGFQFSSGPPPPLPYPDCGADPTPDMLGCDSFTACP